MAATTDAPLHIRRAVAADRPRLIELLAAQLEEHAISIDGDKLTEAIDGALTNPERGIFLIAELERTSIGVAYLSFQWTLEHGGKCVWLEEFYVEPARRGSGIGSAMLAAVIEHAREHDCRAVDLEVEQDHQRAEHLYQRAGFRRHQRRRWVKALAEPS